MRPRLPVVNIALGIILAILLGWLFKVQIVDELRSQRKQIQEQAAQIKALTAGMEQILQIISEMAAPSEPGA